MLKKEAKEIKDSRNTKDLVKSTKVKRENMAKKVILPKEGNTTKDTIRKKDITPNM